MEQKKGLTENDLIRLVSVQLAKDNNLEFDKFSTVTSAHDAASTKSNGAVSHTARVKHEFQKDQHIGKAANAFKTLQKIWTSTAKFIKSQVSKGRCVDFPLCGRFMQIDED
jgi:hypothetical protein